MKLWKSKLKSLTGNMRLLHRSYKMDNSWWKYMMIVFKNIIYQISSYTNEICVLVTKQLSHINSIWYCIHLVTLVSLVLFVLAGIFINIFCNHIHIHWNDVWEKVISRFQVSRQWSDISFKIICSVESKILSIWS